MPVQDGGTRVAISQPVLLSGTGCRHTVAGHQQPDAAMPKQMHLALDVSWTQLVTAWRMPESWAGRHYTDVGLHVAADQPGKTRSPPMSSAGALFDIAGHRAFAGHRDLPSTMRISTRRLSVRR